MAEEIDLAPAVLATEVEHLLGPAGEGDAYLECAGDQAAADPVALAHPGELAEPLGVPPAHSRG